MFGAPSEASVLRSLYEKEIKDNTRTKEKLEEIRGVVRESEHLILKNRNLPVDAQIIAFGEQLAKIREIIDE